MRLLKSTTSVANTFRNLTYIRKPIANREEIVVVHGGAGNIPDALVERMSLGVQMAAHEAFLSLKETRNVVDAVERAIKIMENDEIFNAGYGSRLSAKGEVEMEASIMQGAELQGAGVCAVKDIKHPITLARLVMTKTTYVLMAGEGAMKFARENGCRILEPGALVTKYSRNVFETTKDVDKAGVGTVGAVVMDRKGNVAAGTSTGGLNRKTPGRVSDTSGIGAGTYADNTMGGVSCTGHADSISKVCLAYSIANRIVNMPTVEAIQSRLAEMNERLKTNAGAIAISKLGDVGVGFTTKRMAWAYQRGRILCYGMNPEEHFETKI